MSRSTQIYGLTKEAEAFLWDNAERRPSKTCPNCYHVLDTEMVAEVYTKHDGMLEEDFWPLREITLKDGSKVREVIQAEPWSSGPCYFYCLEDEDGNRLHEWPEEEINNA